MRPITTLAILIGSILFCYAQDETTQSLQKFTSLKVYDRITVNLVKGEENSLTISRADKKDVMVLENEGVLKIRMGLDKFLSANAIEIKVTFTESLALLDANENAKIVAEGVVKTPKIELKAQEAGYIALALEADSTMVKSISGSEIKLSGSSWVQNVTVNTGAKVYNKELLTKETTGTVMAGGRAEIHATEKVIARVKAGSTILVHGNPIHLEKDNTFGGTIVVVK